MLPARREPPVWVCQISRGTAPAIAIAQAVHYARTCGAGYALITGLPAADAKNRAVEIASDRNAGLLLIEDDILASSDLWEQTLGFPTAWERSMAVHFATTRCRNGTDNTRMRADGSVLYSGTPFLALSAPLLARLPRPLFVPYDFAPINDELIPRGPNPRGHGSDIYFWAKLHAIDPPPRIECVGRVEHILHPLNTAAHDLVHPCSLRLA